MICAQSRDLVVFILTTETHLKTTSMKSHLHLQTAPLQLSAREHHTLFDFENKWPISVTVFMYFHHLITADEWRLNLLCACVSLKKLNCVMTRLCCINTLTGSLHSDGALCFFLRHALLSVAAVVLFVACSYKRIKEVTAEPSPCFVKMFIIVNRAGVISDVSML